MSVTSLNTCYVHDRLPVVLQADTAAEAVTNPEACLTSVDTEAGVMDGRFVREYQVVTRLDTRAGAGQRVLDMPVFRLRLAPGGKRMAVASDDVGVSLVSLEAGGMSVTKVDSGHRDFVRGLAWTSDTGLWSASWDTRVELHTV